MYGTHEKLETGKNGSPCFCDDVWPDLRMRGTIEAEVRGFAFSSY